MAASSPLLPHAQYALAEALYLLSKPAEALAALEKACANLEPYRDQRWCRSSGSRSRGRESG